MLFNTNSSKILIKNENLFVYHHEGDITELYEIKEENNQYFLHFSTLEEGLKIHEYYKQYSHPTFIPKPSFISSAEWTSMLHQLHQH